MNDFFEALEYVKERMYKPANFSVTAVQEEIQNRTYGAGTFHLDSKTIRFRVAHKTPTKVGQFVAFWEKDTDDTNQPFAYEEAPDLLVITNFDDNDRWGQFIFPKEVLLEHNVLRSHSTKGKMALRVYSSWDNPTSPQAKKTQEWQLSYFIDMSDPNALSFVKVRELYVL